MAELQDVIDKLENEGAAAKKTGEESIRSVKEIMQENQESPAERKQEREDTRNFQNSLLDKMAGSAGAGGGASPVDKKAGGAFASIAKGLGGLGKGVGKAIGGFMSGASNIIAAGKFAIAFPLFGVGIAGFAIALGASIYVISKMMPSIAEGLKHFEPINGKNLIDVGLGMVGLGAGFAAMGAGKAISGVGNLIGSIADGVGGLFGVKSGQEDIMEKLKKFSKVKLDVKNIKGNAEAMAAYGVAMAAGSAGSMLNTLATLADGAISGLGKLLGGVPVVDQLIAFSKVDVDGKKVKKNADSMVTYAVAMTAGAGATAMKSVGGVFNMIGSFTDGVSKLLGGEGVLETQLGDMKKISEAKGIDGAKIKNVADAMATYAVAMTFGAGATAMKSVASAGNMISTFFDGFSKFFGGKSSLDNQLSDMKKISKAEGIDIVKIKHVTDAMSIYATGMASGAKATGAKAFGDIANFVGGVAKSIGGLLGIKDADPIGDLKKFAKKSVTPAEVTQIQSNTQGLVAYAESTKIMAKISVGTGFGESVSNLLKGVGNWFSSKEDMNPMEAFEKFSGKKFDANSVKKNISALEEFANFKYDGKNSGWRAFAADLVATVPVIEGAVAGSEKVRFLRRNIKFKGLASPDIDFETAKININKLKTALKVQTVSASTDDPLGENDLKPTSTDSLMESINALTAQIALIPVGGNTVNAPNIVKNEGDVVSTAPVVNTRYSGFEAAGF